jgi:hypothetical protein
MAFMRAGGGPFIGPPSRHDEEDKSCQNIAVRENGVEADSFAAQRHSLVFR